MFHFYLLSSFSIKSRHSCPPHYTDITCRLTLLCWSSNTDRTNSKRLEEDSEAAVLNVSSAHQMSQFEKALSKVGITNYHHLTLEELHNNQNIIDILR